MSGEENRDRFTAPEMLDGVGVSPGPDIPAPQPPTEPGHPYESGVQQVFTRAYALVSAALLLSAFVASHVPTPEPDEVLAHQATFQFLFFFEIACVALLSRYVAKLPRDLAAVVLFTVAAVNGASFAVFLMWVPVAALAYGFLMSGAGFASTALIASRRNIDLGSSRGMLLLFSSGVGLITIVTATLRLDAHYWQTSLTGFVVFAVLASYFCDDIASLYDQFDDDHSGWKSAVCGALVLYLNFINVYLILSRMLAWAFSRTRED